MSLLKKATIINSGAMAGILLGTVQTIILSRILGPHGIGQYALSVSVLSLAATFFTFGYPLSFLFFAKKEPARKNEFFSNTFWVLSAIGLMSGVIMAVFVRWRYDYFGIYGLYAILSIAIYMPLVLLRILFRNYLLTDIQAKKLTFIELSATSSSIIFILLVWTFHRLTVDAALISFIMAAAVRAVLGWVWVRHESDLATLPTFKCVRQLSRMGAKQVWPDLMLMANDQVGLLLLKLLLDNFNEVGFFSRAMSISMLLILLSQAVMPVLFSRWAGLEEEAVRAHVEKVLRFVTSFSLILAIALVVFGDFIVIILYGNVFLPAVFPMRILTIGAACSTVNRTFIQLLGGRGMPEKGTYVLAAGTVLTALMSMALIPKLGIIGCASATATSQFMMMVVLFVYGKMNFQLSLKNCVFINREDFFQILRSLRLV